MKKLIDLINHPAPGDSLANYLGYLPEEKWHVVLTQSRDSGLISKSNWEVALERLGGERGGNVEVHRFGHWACGWWEALCVAEDSDLWETAKGICESIEDYPLLDEEHHSKMEEEEAQIMWRDCFTPKERVRHLRATGGDDNITTFSALRKCVEGAFAPFTQHGYQGIIE